MRLTAKLAAATAITYAAILLPTVALAQASIPQPLGPGTLESMVGRVIKAVLGFTGVLALVMFIWGGFQWMISQGSAEALKKAKGTIIWAALGMVICFAAYSIVQALINIL
jgi:hypothetical protein